MNISSRCEYACRAVVELALHYNTAEPMTTTEIAERRGIPEKYLVHILLQLKRNGVVKSLRGAQGGYLLSRPPEEITLGTIIRAIDGAVLDPLPVHDEGGRDISAIWKDVAQGIENVLENITVRDIVDRASASPMYYI